MLTKQENAAEALQRSGSIDVLKTLAILGVLTIHASFDGYSYPVFSQNWLAAVFWGCLTRASVPLFFMCSGALMLDPKKDLPLGTLFGRNLLRILTALFFWAAAYQLFGLLTSGGITVPALIRSLKDLILFRHKFHLYYLHIMILVYVFLPITRILTAFATRQQTLYLLAVWFVLGIVYPVALQFWPFTLLSGIPLKWLISMPYSAIGYGILGDFIRRTEKQKISVCFLVFLFGFSCVFFGTAAMSLRQGCLYELFLEGMSPGVALMAMGLFGMADAWYRDRRPPAFAKTISRASFCIYLVHVFFLEGFRFLGLTVDVLPALVSIPLLVSATFGCSFAVYLVLSRIPLAKRYLI